MAHAELSNTPEQRICAVRLPGTSRARFADARDVVLDLGDWVVVRTTAGEEAGQVVVAPDQWLSPVARDDAIPVLRQLAEGELDALAGQVDTARRKVDPAAEILRQHAPDAFLSGVRFNLDGHTAVVSIVGPLPDEDDALADALARTLGTKVVLEQEHAGSPDRYLLGGGAGRVPGARAETFRELLERRFDVLRNPETFAPQGLPRLGSTVQTRRGRGQLVAVDIRHWRATVRLDGDEEIELGVDELENPNRDRH